MGLNEGLGRYFLPALASDRGLVTTTFRLRRLSASDAGGTILAVGGAVFVACIGLHQLTLDWPVRVALVGIAVILLAFLGLAAIVEVTNNARLLVLDDRIEWAPGLLPRWSGHEPMVLASVSAACVLPKRRAFRIAAVEEGRVRALWLRPVRKDFDALNAVIRDRLRGGRWYESERDFSKRLSEVYSELRKSPRTRREA